MDELITSQEGIINTRRMKLILKRRDMLVNNVTPEGLITLGKVLEQDQLRSQINRHKSGLIKLSIGDKKKSAAIARVELPESASKSITLIKHFFFNSFKYLGPLRDEPKAVYPIEGSVNPSDIGLRGEFTAAVLDLYKNKMVNYLPPNAFVENKKFETTEAPLQDAVLSWLKYMGVVEEVRTRDLGIQGHELKVKTDLSDTLHNLTHVGVGVSQVLPILVMSLLADPGTVLVFEQPEIHLHPKVQSRLADFLLSMSLTGRQCVVETHSEYFINRIRFRSASTRETNISNMIGIYFVEKKKGKSHYREVNVNEYGAIKDWPEGFFDQSHEESERILRAAMEKKKRLRKGGQ